MIPYGRQEVTEEDIKAVVDVLRSDFLTQGPMTPRFEKRLCTYAKAKHAVAVNSATSALHIACMALGLTEGDWLWTSPITFVASANCGVYCGAKIDFVDIDPSTGNMCPKRLAEKLKRAEKQGRLPKIVIPVHLCGQPCDMKEIHRLSLQYGFRIIEDASHAIGGRYLNEPIGNCRFSDIAVFSFHPVKIITSGEGGAALTNQKDLAEQMRRYRTHGITRQPENMPLPSDGPWHYQQIDLGWNYRMTDLHAALGCSQIDRLDEYVAKRHALASHYDSLLKNLPLSPLQQKPEGYSSYHLYVVRLKLDEIQLCKKDIFNALRDRGIGVNIHYIPVNSQPFYKGRDNGEPTLEAEAYYQEALTLPLYPNLSHADQAKVKSHLEAVLGGEKR